MSEQFVQLYRGNDWGVNFPCAYERPIAPGGTWSIAEDAVRLHSLARVQFPDGTVKTCRTGEANHHEVNVPDMGHTYTAHTSDTCVFDTVNGIEVAIPVWRQGVKISTASFDPSPRAKKAGHV